MGENKRKETPGRDDRGKGFKRSKVGGSPYLDCFVSSLVVEELKLKVHLPRLVINFINVMLNRFSVLTYSILISHRNQSLLRHSD
jgi:hypothetical protein